MTKSKELKEEIEVIRVNGRLFKLLEKDNYEKVHDPDVKWFTQDLECSTNWHKKIEREGPNVIGSDDLSVVRYNKNLKMIS